MTETIRTPLQHEILKTNGVNLHVVRAGAPEGKPVILLHGFPEFWYGWRGQIDALVAAGYYLMIPDQRGYNLSDKPEGLDKYHITELVADVIGLMDQLQAEKVTLIGHDWGAMVTWWTALMHPERLEKIAILNVPHPEVFRKTLTSDPQQMLKSWYAGMFQLPFLPEALFTLNGNALLENAVKGSARKGSFTAADMQLYREAWARPNALSAMLNWYRAYVQRPIPEREDWRVTVPTLMLWGAKDFALSEKMAQPSIDLCDDGQLHIIKRATHWVQHDAAEDVNAHLIDFLGR
ncbi:MAG: alpha/beta hydrolase [Anaerolineae bacterium]